MAIGSPQWMYASGEAYTIDQSLRFNDDDLAKLSWTPASAGNRKTWTYSAWIKLANLGSQRSILSATGTQYTDVRISSNHNLVFYIDDTSSPSYSLYTTPLLRDSSAWYHIVIAFDTTQSTASNRVKIYVNGEQETVFDSTSYPAQDYQGTINNNILHSIGTRSQGNGHPYDGYLAEVNFIDGQQLTPADFGETGDYGEWKPIEYSGTYGTNGFYLPFKQDYTVEGFSTVTYSGNGGEHYIGGVGYQPDLTWIKNRSRAYSHVLVDSVRGANKLLQIDSPNAEGTEAQVIDFSADGLTVDDIDSGTANQVGDNYVAWNWDMGGSNATNTDGTITSTVRANTTYGQSIVSYSGNGTNNATVGHGLSSAPELVIIKRRDAATNWNVGADAIGWANHLYLNTSAAQLNGYNPITGQASTLEISNDSDVNNSSGTYIAYCFHSVTGYSKIGSYTGNASTTNAITTGFKPAFVLIKRTDATRSWYIFDSTREPTNPITDGISPDTSAAEETTGGGGGVNFDNTGFTIKDSGEATNASGGTYIYMAFADKREYAYWLDQSGNNNDWTSNNLTESDISVDSPSNNFATFSPLMLAPNMGTELSEGNLKNYEGSTHSGYPHNSFSTMSVTSGKWYFEVRNTLAYGAIGICNLSDSSVNQLPNSTASPVTNMPSDAEGWAFKNGNGNKEHNNSNVSYGSAITSNDVVMCAFDVDAGKIWWGVNGTWIASGNPATASNPAYTGETFGLACPVVTTENGSTAIINFGQDSSFAGNKTAQGNQDSNGIGDFYYTPPNGFLALCSKSLPDVAVVPSEHFNTVLYTGNNGASLAVSGVGFQPDFTWIKERSSTSHHFLMDAVRGATKFLQSSTTIAEVDNSDVLQSFDSDGFTVGTSGGTNASDTYASWNWKANGSGSSNTNGSITSTVSANVDAGFSIVSYSGNDTSGATIGHGLSKKPEFIIVKARDNSAQTESWNTYNVVSGATKYIFLNGNGAAATHTPMWNDTEPTSSVFSVGNYTGTNNDTDNYIAYCFHSVDGYSKVGSFEGNSNADGTFVYTGFRPAFVLMKCADSSTHWYMYDSARNPSNVVGEYISADDSGGGSDDVNLDFVSNGFKMRTNFGGLNSNTMIYICFAETPFKYSNAR